MSPVNDPFAAASNTATPSSNQEVHMKFSSTTLARLIAAAAGLTALAVPVSAASAAGFTLSLSAPSTPVVGTPTILQATGTMPPSDIPFPYWFSLDAVPTTLTSTCPPDSWEGFQFANSYGTVVVRGQIEVPDPAGNFSIPVAIVPSAPGSLLLCGYTDDGADTTLDAASLMLNIQPKSPTTTTGPPQPQPPTTTGSPQPQPPTTTGTRATRIPTQVSSGIRSCLARLALNDARGCIQSAVKRANHACRKLQYRSRRTVCLRAVRKIAGRYS
jgi:hypothetical protein